MKLYQIKEYSGKALKGRRAEAFMISLCIPAVIVFFRLAELCISSVILYFSSLTPMEIFYGSEIWWTLSDFLFTILKIIMLSAVIPAVIKYFSGILEINLPEQKDTKLFGKNLTMNFIIKAISLILLIPVIISGYISARLIIKGNGSSVFLTVHTLMLTIIFLAVWIWALSGITALPFLIYRNPEKKILRLVSVSFRIMKNSRKGLFKIILFYTLFCLIPFTFIYVLPEFFTSLTLYINICIKEAEYIGGKNLYSRNSESLDTAKISHRKKRRIKTASDKA
ncbi:MAG: hypothetical protein PUH54_10195 [Oscillospiraceae bacterium]|nr:hypothetical protein [Oscillospiraceae bacterium]